MVSSVSQKDCRWTPRRGTRNEFGNPMECGSPFVFGKSEWRREGETCGLIIIKIHGCKGGLLVMWGFLGVENAVIGWQCE